MNITPAALRALFASDSHNAALAMVPGGIEAQEAAGQAAMVATSRLPKQGLDRAVLESMGFTIGGEANKLFVAATLPTGWELKPTGHSMHTDIVDDKGRKRGSIFYKAAYYDERADMRLLPRYKIDTNLPCDAEGNTGKWNECEFRAICITDQNTPVHYIAISADDGPRDDAYFTMLEEQQKEASAWLDEHFPDHKNPAAYWND